MVIEDAEHAKTFGPHKKLNVVISEMTENALTPLLEGHDLVVVIIGQWPKPGETSISAFSDVANALVPGMKAKGITRFFMVLGSGFAC